jgi:hypothetical protein
MNASSKVVYLDGTHLTLEDLLILRWVDVFLRPEEGHCEK